MDKWKWNAADYNGVLKLAEKWLKGVLASTEFDVETVELKGRCPSVVWESGFERVGQALHDGRTRQDAP